MKAYLVVRADPEYPLKMDCENGTGLVDFLDSLNLPCTSLIGVGTQNFCLCIDWETRVITILPMTDPNIPVKRDYLTTEVIRV